MENPDRVGDFKRIIRRTLQDTGAMDRARGLIRAEIYNAIRDETLAEPTRLSNENLMINELIREYLDFNRYRDTLSVMMPETGQPSVPVFSREFLARRLHIIESNETRRVPLLYVLLQQAIDAAIPLNRSDSEEEPEAVDLAYAAEELEALDRRMSEQARAAVEGRHAGMYSKR